MSISKAQASALAEGFLDGIGSSKEGLRPKETFSEFIVLAGEMAEQMQENMIRHKIIASGKGASSIEVQEPELKGSILSIDITMNDYLRFQNKGVRGTKSGNGLYQFKNDRPSQKMVLAFREWIKRAKISTRSVKKYSAHGQHEAKNKSIAQFDNAYAIARSVKQHGIKATGFLDQAAESTRKKVSDRLGAALKIDVLDSLKG
jgi:hypothetical protein